MDREACSAAIHGVTKSRTQLSDRTELNRYKNIHIDKGIQCFKTNQCLCAQIFYKEVKDIQCVKMYPQ